MASGIDPVLIRTQSVLDGPYGATVRDSLRAAVPTGSEPHDLDAEQGEKNHEYR
jgi:hypothetical protein